MWNAVTNERGFGIIDQVLAGDEVSHLLVELARSPLSRTRAGARHALRHLAVAKLACDPRLVGLAQKILGKEATPYRATFFDKSLRANWLVAWHQDTALPVQRCQDAPGWRSWSVKDGVTYGHAPADVLSQIVALRVHLDDSTVQNKPLRVLPGTHVMGILDDATIHQLVESIQCVDCVVPRGGVVAMRPLTVHSSSKSRDATSRRVLHIEYAPSLVLKDGMELALA
jgi:hypothetical protein